MYGVINTIMSVVKKIIIKACIDYIPTNTINVYFTSGKCQQDKGYLLRKKNQIFTPFSNILRLIRSLLLSLFSPNFRCFTFFFKLLGGGRRKEKLTLNLPTCKPVRKMVMC